MANAARLKSLMVARGLAEIRLLYLNNRLSAF